MKHLTEEKLKDFRDKFGDLFHYIKMVDWIEKEIDEAVTKAIPIEPPVKPEIAFDEIAIRINEGKYFVEMFRDIDNQTIRDMLYSKMRDRIITLEKMRD